MSNEKQNNLLLAAMDVEEMVKDQVNAIEFEIRSIPGTSYNKEDLLDAKEKLANLRAAIAEAK